MGYYMRYISSSKDEISLILLKQGLDARYKLIPHEFDENSGALFFEDVYLGVVEINSSGDDIFEDDIADLKALVEGETGAVPVQQVLNKAHAIIAVEAVWQASDSESVLEKLDPLWDWLFEHYEGLLQADNEGFYNKTGLILALDLKI